MSIHDESPKIKSMVGTFLDSLIGQKTLIFIIITGVSVASFCLGLMSAAKDTPAVIIQTDPNLVVLNSKETDSSVTINSNSQNTSATAQNFGSESPKPTSIPTSTPEIKTNPTGAFVASAKGKKYYPVNCPAAKNLSATNRVYFVSSAEAESKGYTLSTSCH